MSTAVAIKRNRIENRKIRKTGKLKSISLPKIEKSEVLKAMGWGELPAELITVIDEDLELFMSEYKGNYTTVDDEIRERRNRIQYWMNNYKEGICGLETAKSALMS